VVVVSLAGQEKPSGLVREKEGAMAVAEAEVEAEDASTKLLVTSRQTDKARIVVLVVIVPPSRYLQRWLTLHSHISRLILWLGRWLTIPASVMSFTRLYVRHESRK
jgi:hypothetical protein